MKYINVLLITAIISFYSCSDDIINQEDPVGTIYFNFDSIPIWFSPGNNSGYSSYTFQQTISASRVKVEYIIQTNADSTHSEAVVKDSSNGTPVHPVVQYYYRNVDSALSYTMDIPSQPIHLKLEVEMNTYFSLIPHYIRLKNIKVTKQ